MHPPLPARAGLALATLLAIPTALAAQRPASSFLPFERIGMERGLSNPTVTAIAQGTHGFLWFGTQDGLNLYDGVRFTVFRPTPDHAESLSDAWITALAPTSEPGGGVWIGTLQGGLNLLERGERVRAFRHDPEDPASLSSDYVNAVVQAAGGTVWVGTVAGLDALDPRTGRVRRHRIEVHDDSAHYNNNVISLAEAPGGPLWVGTRRGVYVFERRTDRLEEVPLPLQSRTIQALLYDRAGLVWIGTPRDLVGLDVRSRRIVHHYTIDMSGRGELLADGVRALAQGRDGRIWIGGEEGIAAYEPSTGAFTRHRRDPNEPRSLGGPIVRALHVDRGGVLWAGLESYGLSKHAPAAVHFDLLRNDRYAARSLSDGYVRGIAEDASGNIWIGTQYGGLNRVDARSRRITAHRHRPGDPGSLPSDNVWALLEDRSGVFWVGTHHAGAGTFDRAGARFTRFPLVPADASVNVLYEDSAGRLYAGLEGRGLVAVAPDRRSAESYGATTGERRILVNNDVQSILEDRYGRLWVGGMDGLTRLDSARQSAVRFRGMTGHSGALASNFVTNIIQDSRGTIWVATKGGGLHRYEESSNSFTVFGTAHGLPHSFIYGVLEDAQGRLWLSSDDGIAMFDAESGLVTRYGVKDGLQGREFNRRAHLRTRDGTMYFGGISGVNIFRPDNVLFRPAPPAVSLVAIEAGGRRKSAIGFNADSVVTLRHDATSFMVSFAALDFTAPEKIQYSYRLEGVDRDWVPAGGRMEAAYANLPPGRRVFRVIAAGPSGTWNREGAAVTIVVAPAWWATWWARALQFLLLGSIVAGAHRLRLRAVARRSAELERRVQDQTRDLTEAKERLHESLARERDAARRLLEMAGAVPGAVFRLREAPDGRREFEFASAGVARLANPRPGAPGATDDPRRVAERLLGELDPLDRVVLEDSLAASRRTLDNWRVEVRWVPAGSTEQRWLAIQAHAARHPDGGTVWTGVMTDATASRRAESQRLELESKMLQAQQAESLAVLAGGVAHDFNNVLVSVLVGAELLEYQIGDNERAASTVRRIRSAGQRAAELTQQMLAYAGKGRITVQRVNLSRIVDEMLPLVRANVPRTIDLDVHVGPTPPIVEADATQLRQIVMNLVTNAGEAIGDRSGLVEVRVDVEHRPMSDLELMHAADDMPETGPYVVLHVKDDGAGIEPELLERIFEPFFTTKFTGRGLGLAALLGIVRTHHGGLTVISAPHRGTEFLVYFPLAVGAEEPTPTRLFTSPARPSDRLRVLVADDEPFVREAAQAVLESAGYDVVLVEDGEAALASADDPTIDAFLLDVTMPRMSGAAAARALRGRGLAKPIVLMSGYAEEDLLKRGLTADADGFVKKPFQVSELLEALRGVLGGTPASTQNPARPSKAPA